MRIFFLFAIIATLASCKAPLPVYFDKPMGAAKDTFPETIQGNYYPTDEIIRKGLEAYEGKFCVKDGKIGVKDTSKQIDKTVNTTTENPDSSAVKNTPVDPFPGEQNNFSKIASLNTLSLEHIDSAVNNIDKEKKIAFAFIKITKNRISVVLRDSTNEDHDVTLIQLNPKIKLTSFAGEYYLNIQTPYGWELMKIEEWNKGEFLNLIAFYFTNYNDKTGDVNVFLKSTSVIYPNLKPVYNSEHLIVGVKAATDPKLVKEAFKFAENNLELIKVKE